MKSYSQRFALLLGSIIVLVSPVVSLGQDRDLTGGSSSGSIRPDVLDTSRGPRTRMLSPEKRARLVQEFDSFRGVETLIDGPRFEVLKDNYTAILKGLAPQKQVAADLTPEKYFTFRIMARELSKQKPGVTADLLAQGMISSYIETGDFMPPTLAAAFSKRDVKKAESDARAAIRLLMKQRQRGSIH